MTKQDAKKVLHNPNRQLVLVALSYVNLTDKELNVIILRHLRGHTQFETAEELLLSVNGVQNIENSALIKCSEAWKHLVFIKALLNTVL